MSTQKRLAVWFDSSGWWQLSLAMLLVSAGLFPVAYPQFGTTFARAQSEGGGGGGEEGCGISYCTNGEECCGEVCMDGVDQECCGGEVISVGENSTTRCCNGVTYENTTHACCCGSEVTLVEDCGCTECEEE
jgi:hypothetical protein